MTIDLRRIKSVAAALKGIRERVDSEGDEETWSTSAYNKALSMLDGAIDTESDHLLLEEDELAGRDLLVHLDSMIAFLETFEKEGGSVVSLFGRKEG